MDAVNSNSLLVREIFAPLLNWLLARFSPNATFFLFVAIVTIFGILIVIGRFGLGKFCGELKTYVRGKMLKIAVCYCIGIGIIYFIFWPLVLSMVLDNMNPYPEFYVKFINGLIKIFEKIGLLK